MFNGITLHRPRRNINYKVQALNKNIFDQRINQITNIKVGDIVISLNGINIFNLELSEIYHMLSNIPLQSIESFNDIEWRRRNRENFINNLQDARVTQLRNNICNSNHEVQNGDTAISNSSSSQVQLFNRTINNAMDLNLTWDYENKCKHCGCLYLTTEKNRKICCNNGIFLHNSSSFPKLRSLPPQLKELIISRLSHFGRNSVSYNNILALGATGVDNGSPTSGWEVRYGNHSVILHGRTYHFLTTSSGSNGLHYFLYDAQLALLSHGDKLNSRSDTGNEFKRIYPEYLQSLFSELKEINILVQEIERIGYFSLNPNTDITSTNMLVELNSKTAHFDVAAITSSDVTGNRVLTIRRKGSLSTAPSEPQIVN
mgnify:CR=1 FL=1